MKESIMKKFIVLVISLFFMLTSTTFAGDVITESITSGTQMAPHNTGVSIVKVLDLSKKDIARWEFSWQLGVFTDGSESGGTIIPVYYCSNYKYATTALGDWASVGTNYVYSGLSEFAMNMTSGVSRNITEFTSGVSPVKYIAFGFLNGQTGVTPVATVHIR
jgi:hypothetical protein